MESVHQSPSTSLENCALSNFRLELGSAEDSILLKSSVGNVIGKLENL